MLKSTVLHPFIYHKSSNTSQASNTSWVSLHTGHSYIMVHNHYYHVWGFSLNVGFVWGATLTSLR